PAPAQWPGPATPGLHPPTAAAPPAPASPADVPLRRGTSPPPDADRSTPRTDTPDDRRAATSWEAPPHPEATLPGRTSAPDRCRASAASPAAPSVRYDHTAPVIPRSGRPPSGPAQAPCGASL